MTLFEDDSNILFGFLAFGFLACVVMTVVGGYVLQWPAFIAAAVVSTVVYKTLSES